MGHDFLFLCMPCDIGVKNRTFEFNNMMTTLGEICSPPSPALTHYSFFFLTLVILVCVFIYLFIYLNCCCRLCLCQGSDCYVNLRSSRGISSLNPWEVTFAREGGACNSEGRCNNGRPPPCLHLCEQK